MTILPAENFDYTARDFEALRARLFNLIQTYFVDGDGRPIWTDTQAKSFGNILVESLAHVGDNVSYYRDLYTLEKYLPTVAHRENLIKIVRLIGYELDTPTAATVDLKLSIPAAMAGDVVFAARDQVKSAADPNIIYELIASAIITAGNTEVTAAAENAVTVEEAVASTALPNQRHLMAGTPYLDGTMNVTDDVGAWTEVDDFLSSRATDLHFRVEVDAFDQASSVFGDGINGAVPVGSIDFAYRKGGGTAGKVEAGALTRLVMSYSDSFGTPATVSVVNETASSGGEDRESTAQARVNAPADLRALNRTVSREDFETNGARADGVARTLMVTSNEVSGITENTGKLFIVAYGTELASGRFAPATPSSAQLTDVEDQITTERPHTVTFLPIVLAAPFLDVNVESTVYLEEGYSAATVKANVEAALADFFACALADGTANPEIKFGWYYKNASGDFSGELAWSDVFNVVRDSAGVRKVSSGPAGLKLNGAAVGVMLDAQDFPRLGSVALVDGDTGSTL